MNEAQSQLSSLGESMCEGGACMNPGSGNGMNQGNTGMAAGQGQWSPGDSTAMGQGSGGAGRGNGGAGPDDLATDFNLTSEKALVNDQGGPIIGETTIFGKQLIGESRKEYGAAVASAAARAEDAVESMRVPRELRDSVQAYFGSVQEIAGEASGEATGGASEEPATE